MVFFGHTAGTALDLERRKVWCTKLVLSFRYPNLGYGVPEGPIGPHPLIVPHHQRHPFLTHDIPQFPHHPPLHEVPHHVPLVYTAARDPPQVLVVPLRGVFPPFIERIVQRIQTFWSVYNPPEVLTRPTEDFPSTTTKRPIKNKVRMMFWDSWQTFS